MHSGKKSKGRRNVIRVLLFVLLLGTLTGAWYLGKMGFDELGERRAGMSFYEQLAKPGKTDPSALPTPDTENDDKKEIDAPVIWTPASEIDFSALQETCPDIVGWIRLEDTVIDYPIVQGEDNDFYLHHLPDRTPNSAGSIMMNCTNDAAFNDAVTVLHGHHMSNGSMFSGLEDYKDEAFYHKHPTIRLCTPTGDCDVAVFAAYTVNGHAYGYVTSFADEAEFEAFIRKAVSSTRYETDVEVAFGDRLLLLSTCSYSFDGARYVVIGKIVTP